MANTTVSHSVAVLVSARSTRNPTPLIRPFGHLLPGGEIQASLFSGCSNNRFEHVVQVFQNIIIRESDYVQAL